MNIQRKDGPDRRRATRARTPGAKAFCQIKGSGARYQVSDLSVGGAQLNEGPPLAPGTKLEIAIVHGSKGTTTFEGQVVRGTGEGLGVQFGELQSSDAERLTEMVTNALLASHWASRWFH